MAEGLFIIGSTMILIGLLYLLTDNCGSSGVLAFFLGVIGTCFLLDGIIHLKSCNPTAMDVYQNKTTLEITYRNGVPVDSVVVFKDKKK